MTNEQHVWRYLWEQLGNDYGVAGLMGNLYAESNLNPTNMEDTYERYLGVSDEIYTKIVDDGSYTRFASDGVGYGIAQWTFSTRKQNLLAFAKEKNKSIGDLDMQLEFLLKELGSQFKSVLKTLINAKSIQEASDIVLTQFENPQNQSDFVKMIRMKMGEKYYNLYSVEARKEETMSYDPKKVIAVAMNEVGYLEKKDKTILDDKTANAGSNNFTKYARDLDALGVYNTKKNGAAWCDIFVDWCFVQAYGLEAAMKMMYQKAGSANCGAGCKYSRQYYKNNKRLFDTPEIGDQIFFCSASDPNTIQHTGLVYDLDETYIYTIEGNTTGANGVIANGGGVCKKKYKRTYARLAGFGRPNWGLAAPEEEKPKETPAPAKPTVTSGHMLTITGNVNMRTGDSTKYKAVDIAKKDECFEHVATSLATGWYAIRVADGSVLWISNKYAKVWQV